MRSLQASCAAAARRHSSGVGEATPAGDHADAEKTASPIFLRESMSDASTTKCVLWLEYPSLQGKPEAEIVPEERGRAEGGV